MCGLITLPNTIVSGDSDDPTRDMANWTALRDLVNGQLDNDNIKASAGIAISKTALGIYTAWTDWTPTYYGTTSAGTGTYTTQEGRYCQIGKVVTFSAYVVTTNHTGTGNLRATVPIASGANSILTPISLYYSTINLTNASVSPIIAYITNNSTTVVFAETRDNDTSIAIAVPTACSIFWAGSYEVA
jgi:hypothetical protein